MFTAPDRLEQIRLANSAGHLNEFELSMCVIELTEALDAVLQVCDTIEKSMATQPDDLRVMAQAQVALSIREAITEHLIGDQR